VTDRFAPKVSIVIPVYNGSAFVNDAIESALCQTYKNLEVVVVNDGSSDGGRTDEAVRRFGSRVRYFSKPNGGCASALNLGLEKMRGEYFSWLSHDDLYHPEKIAHQIDILSALDDKRTIVYGPYELIDERSRSIGCVLPQAKGSCEQLNTPLFPLMRGLIHGCSLLIAKDLFQEFGHFDESLKSTQDYALWFRFLRQVPIRFDERVLIKSRVHPGQGTHTIKTHPQEMDALWSGFVKDIKPEEAAAIDGSPYRFFRNMEKFLAPIGCEEAHKLAQQSAAEALRETKISVVIPFYNRVDWTLEAIESALRQTHRNLEIIVVDDGSTEDISPITRLLAVDRRLRYVHQEHSGAGTARNAGVRCATGAYIAFLDSDDRFLPNKIETQLLFMEERGSAFSHTSYYRADASCALQQTIDTSGFRGKAYPEIIASCPIATPTVMAATELLRRHPFPETIGIGEDIVAWISIAEEQDIEALAEPLSIVRISAETTSGDIGKTQRGLLNIISAVLDHPVHGRNHAEILRSLENLYALKSTELQAEKQSASASRRIGLGDRLSRPRIGGVKTYQMLFRRGLRSIEQDGVLTTSKKCIQWIRRQYAER